MTLDLIRYKAAISLFILEPGSEKLVCPNCAMKCLESTGLFLGRPFATCARCGKPLELAGNGGETT